MLLFHTSWAETVKLAEIWDVEQKTADAREHVSQHQFSLALKAFLFISGMLTASELILCTTVSYKTQLIFTTQDHKH